ncbi:helix-turn-helix domain-containing protein [Cohnella thailandensis]|uniref:AraC family transcriptional regulator n=1 Tax=Cohnella thailandensis TaxID=557557 RepID=A0A841SUE6_9BACL|nr:helix-turn-helix domain-containing protein [Cohnella thailandensis]MBB6634882.1 AraC family transcriptional regulator [Cohnella thailandensis]MBP1975896.1 AraC-like DNA-binding protein [Cohnella thailandensis]
MRSLSYLTKMTIFGCLLSMLPVLFIGYFSYATSSREIQKHVNEGKMQLLSQINANVEQILTTVNHTLNQVINSTVLKSALNSPLTVSDFKLYDNLRNELRHMQTFDTKLEDVVLVNERNDWMVKNSGVYRFSEYEYAEQLSAIIREPAGASWTLNPSSWFYSEESAGGAICPYSISLVKKLPVTGLTPYGLVMANIPSCSLQAQLLNESNMQAGSNASDTIMVLDESYRILLHPDRGLIGQPASAAGFGDTARLEFSSGQFKSRVNDRSFAISYYKSPYNGWTYVSLTSLSSLTHESQKIGFYTLAVCLAILLLTTLLAWFGSRRMYSPIQKLLRMIDDRLPGTERRRTDEFQVIGEQMHRLFQSNSRLEDQVRQHLKQARTFYLVRAYQGQTKLSELLDRLGSFGYGSRLEEWRQMAVMTLQIDSLEATRYERRDMELLLFSVHNMIEELIPQGRRFDPVAIEQTVVLLYGSPDPDRGAFNAELYSVTEDLQGKFLSFLGLSVSIGMSLPFESIKQLPIAYREGLDALKHRLKLGEGIVVQYEQLNSGKHYLKINYPAHSEAELIDAIKLADAEKAKESLSVFMGKAFAAEMTPQEYQIPLTRLLNSLIMVMQESGISLSKIRPSQGTLYEEMIDLGTVPDIQEWFWTNAIQPMLRVFADRQSSQYQNISEKIIDLVQKHYDTDLSLEECASRLNYNANYLSSVFRKETNVSFSEYLAAYRFNMAKKWLADTDMPIKDIAARLRYNNPQNFIRSFRKQEGMTPGQYREKHSKE